MSLGRQSVEKLSRFGHTLHFDRGTYTHVIFAQDTRDLPKEQEILRDGKPIFSNRLGRNIQIGDLLPERVALAVNGKGEVIGQNDFAERYQQYLNGFFSDKTIEYEHVPNVIRFLLKRIDPSKTPSEGKVRMIDFEDDPLNAGTAKETGKWAPDGSRIDDWKRANPELAAQFFGPQKSERDSKMEVLVELFQSGQIDADTFQARSLSIFSGKGAPAPEPKVEPASEAKAEPKAHEAPKTEHETAPCGQNIKKGYLKQHQRFCKETACNIKADS